MQALKLQAAQRIRDVSGKTEDLSMKVSSSLGEELQDIQSSVCSLTSISGDLEKSEGQTDYGSPV